MNGIKSRYCTILDVKRTGMSVFGNGKSQGKIMTTKEKAISVIERLADDVSLDEVIDRLYLLRKIELGIEQADSGDVLEHDCFMDELEAECPQPFSHW